MWDQAETFRHSKWNQFEPSNRQPSARTGRTADIRECGEAALAGCEAGFARLSKLRSFSDGEACHET